MKRFMMAVALIFMSVAAHAQGTWSAVQSVSVAGMTHGVMYYQYLLLNYSATGNKATVLVYEHENSEGDACYPGGNCAQLATAAAGAGGTGVNQWFNNSTFQNRYCANGCIILSPYADQTSDPSGATSNFGGYGDTPGSEPNERGVIAVINATLSAFNANPNGVLVTGDSLGGIGSQAIGLDYGVGTGSLGHIVTATMPFSGAIFRGGLNAPTNAQVAQIQGGGVQINVNGTGDTGTSSNPALWASPLWNAIAGAPTGLVAPAPAAAVGYNTLTFGPSIHVTPGVLSFNGGQNWVQFSFNGATYLDNGVVTNPDGSITLDGSGGSGFGANLTTGVPGPGQTYNPLNFTGQSFAGGGYFQATMKSNSTFSFWMNDAETMNGGTIGIGPHPWPGQPFTFTVFLNSGAHLGVGDDLGIVFITSAVPALPLIVHHIITPTDTLATIAASWAASVNANGTLAAAGITATVAGQAAGSLQINSPNNINPGLQLTYTYSGTGTESITWTAPYGDWIEVDMAEFDCVACYGGAIHNWYSSANGGQAVSTFGSGSTFNDSTHTNCCVGANFQNYHDYGWLWVPATASAQGYAKWFFDGVQVGNTITWNQYNGTLPPPMVDLGRGGSTAYSVMDVLHFIPILGSGNPNTNTTISKVQIWQASGLADLPQITSSPTGYPGPPAGGRAGASPLYYLLDPNLGHDVWDTYRVFPAAQPLLDILFAQVTSGGTTPTAGAPLPSGFLHVSGNQVIDGSGNNVRMACTGYANPTGNIPSDMTVIRAQGFNCIRVPWFDKVSCPSGVCSFTAMDPIVAAASTSNLKVIFDHASNEGVDGTSACKNQQANGIWYDLNGAPPWNATNGTDGCGTTGTVTYTQFKTNTVAFATHYAGNSTVIGFDLHNEPTTFGNPACCSTGGTGTGNFQISGGQILAPNGSAFNASGPNVYWNATTMAQLCPTSACTKLLADFPGINFIRVVWENGYTQSGMEPYIGYLTALGIVVDICDFDISPGQPPASGATLTAQTAWYSGLAATYKNNPYVWLEAQNEMYGPGATIASNQQALYNAVRAQSSSMIVVMGLPGGGNIGTVGTNGQVNGSTMTASVYSTMHNIVWDLHFYGYIVNNIVGTYSTDIPTIQGVLNGSVPGAYGIAATQSIQSADGVVPVFIGEVGNSTTGSALDPNGSQVVQAASTDTNAKGFAAYAVGTFAIGVTCCNALTDGSSNLISPYGTFVSGLITAASSGRAISGTVFGANWGAGNGADAKAMAEDVGAAVQAAAPGTLIIVPGIFNNGTLFNGVARGSPSLPITAGSIADLTTVGTNPVVCCTGHVLYTVHDMPTSDFNVAPDSGTAATTMRNTAWGYLETTNKAPIWVGKMGASLDNTNGQLSDETAWAAGLTQYLNGSLGAQGGPTFTGCQQPIGSDWWTFGNLAGQGVDGTLNPDGSNKAGQQAYWGTLLYATCGGGAGGGGGTNVQATRVNDFSKSIGINTQVQSYGAGQPYTNGAGMVSDLNYIGIRQLRDGDAAATAGAQLSAMTTLANNGFHWTIVPTITGNTNPYTFVIASRLTNVKAIDALSSPHALLDVEMFNEPINWGVTYAPCGTGGGGLPFTCVATADAAYYTAIKADSQVGSLPTWSATEIGAETPNVGMQFLTIPTGTAATFPAGTKYADVYNIHIYPFFNSAVGLIDPGTGIVGNAHDQMQFQLSADFVTTFANGYAGLPLNTVLATPHVITEFGLSTAQVDARTKAVNLANGFLDAYFIDNFPTSFAYELYEEGDGYGYETTTATPTLAATYMHNFTSAIADGGATAATFAPGTLTYSLANLPANAHSTLMQASNGHFKLVVWSNEQNYNLTSHAPITISPTSVTLTLNAASNVMVFDDTIGDVTAPTQTLTAVTTVNFPISDHIAVLDIVASGTCTTNCGGGGAGATSWNPSDSAGMTMTGSNLIATSASGHTNVRSNTSQTTGNVCWGIRATTITADWDAGLSNATYSLASLLGIDGNGIGFNPNSTGGAQGVFYNNGVLSSGTGVSPNGEEEDFCANLTTQMLWVTNATMRGNGFAWNNSTTANPATGAGGLSFVGMPCPCFITFNEGQVGGVATMIPTGPMAVSLPASFSFWQAAVTGTGRPFVLTMP